VRKFGSGVPKASARDAGRAELVPREVGPRGRAGVPSDDREPCTGSVLAPVRWGVAGCGCRGRAVPRRRTPRASRGEARSAPAPTPRGTSRRTVSSSRSA